MICKYCNQKAIMKSYRDRNGQTNKEIVCLDCHYSENKIVDKKYNKYK
jgi:hypothetical protein